MNGKLSKYTEINCRANALKNEFSPELASTLCVIENAHIQDGTYIYLLTYRMALTFTYSLTLLCF